MIDLGATKLWYGRHEASGQVTQVIFDPTLPGMPSGQVYLYNAARDSIVPYQLKTVEKFLKAAGKDEARDLKSALGPQFRTARKEYLKAYRKSARQSDGD